MINVFKNQLIIFAVALLFSACAGTTGQTPQSATNDKRDGDSGTPVKISGYIDAGGTVNSR